jgi:hypothetical protein
VFQATSNMSISKWLAGTASHLLVVAVVITLTYNKLLKGNCWVLFWTKQGKTQSNWETAQAPKTKKIVCSFANIHQSSWNHYLILLYITFFFFKIYKWNCFWTMLFQYIDIYILKFWNQLELDLLVLIQIVHSQRKTFKFSHLLRSSKMRDYSPEESRLAFRKKNSRTPDMQPLRLANTKYWQSKTGFLIKLLTLNLPTSFNVGLYRN